MKSLLRWIGWPRALATEQAGADPAAAQPGSDADDEIAFAAAQNRVNAGALLESEGLLEEAEAKYLEALSLYPRGAGIHVHLGNVRFDRGNLERARESFQEALRLKPRYPGALYSLARVHIKCDELSQANKCLETAIAENPSFHAALVLRGLVLLLMGFSTEAIECLRNATDLDSVLESADANNLSACLFAFNYAPNLSTLELLAHHLSYDDRFCAPFRGPTGRHSNSPDPERRLRIGYLSGDLRQHVVSRFLEPVLIHHDRANVELFGYYSCPQVDAVTPRMRAQFDHWRDISRLGDEEAFELIQGDKIDVLVELSGHTEFHRLPLVARKPAPVQATWLGYLNSTGIRSIDYRICDAYTDPAGRSEKWSVEQAARMPNCQWCLPLAADLPPVSDLPMLRNGYVTFGSFNNPSKVNERVIDTWASLLHETPHSRLAMIGVSVGEAIERLRGLFGDRGISRDRLELRPRRPGDLFFLAFQEVDLALDPFPYNGGTTSFDCLAMGVPFVTLEGDRPSARGGVSILMNLGLPELIAESPAHYIATASALARNPERLQVLRAGMRERLSQSPLCDIVAYTNDLENLYRSMWHRWCLA